LVCEKEEAIKEERISFFLNKKKKFDEEEFSAIEGKIKNLSFFLFSFLNFFYYFLFTITNHDLLEGST
jgi:hypothetical protein